MKTVFSLSATVAAVVLATAASSNVASAQPQPPFHTNSRPSLTFIAAPPPVWYPPTNWTVAPPSAMVVKVFSIASTAGQSAKVAVSAFPGDVGGTLANVNRWRVQIGLPPIEESALGSVTQSLAVAGGNATLVDLSNTNGTPARLVAAIVPRGTNTWFYKLTGDAPVVARERARFMQFVQTVAYPQP